VARARCGFTLSEVVTVVAVLAVLALILMPAGMFAGPRPAARRAACMSNMKQLVLALRLYADDWEGRYPPAGKWDRDAVRYAQSNLPRPRLWCPDVAANSVIDPARRPDVFGYGLNVSLAGARAASVSDPTRTVALFETDLPQPAAGRAGAVADPARHRGGNVYAFSDGHVKWLPTVPAFRAAMGSR